MSYVQKAVENWPGRLIDSAGIGLGLVPVPEVVTAKAANLCAGLSELALAAYEATGGGSYRAQVCEAATLLALLTKADDEVIDDREFHRGMATDRQVLRDRTRMFLDPTLLAIRYPVTGGCPRVQMASLLGERLRALSGHPERLAHLYEVLARGWQTQVDAVATFTAHPGTVGEAQAETVTAAISRDWLLMISLVGLLPADAGRGISADEEAAFADWGRLIQSVDALADLEKDLADGHVATRVGVQAWQQFGEDYLTAAVESPESVYGLLATADIDLGVLPTEAQLDELVRRQSGLGRLADLLRWIHGFLLFRYLNHPQSCRRMIPGKVSGDSDSYRRYLERVCSVR